jgi:hypothetical protein
MFTYIIASYGIAGEVASSSSGRANRNRSTRNLGTGGARGREARRGLA